MSNVRVENIYFRHLKIWLFFIFTGTLKIRIYNRNINRKTKIMVLKRVLNNHDIFILWHSMSILNRNCLNRQNISVYIRCLTGPANKCSWDLLFINSDNVLMLNFLLKLVNKTHANAGLVCQTYTLNLGDIHF